MAAAFATAMTIELQGAYSTMAAAPLPVMVCLQEIPIP